MAEEDAMEVLNTTGTRAKILQAIPVVHPQNGETVALQLLLSGLEIVQLEKVLNKGPPLQVQIAQVAYEDDGQDQEMLKATVKETMQTVKDIMKVNPSFREYAAMINQQYERMMQVNPHMVAHFAASMTTAEAQELQKVLEATNAQDKLRIALELLKKELELSKLQQKIANQIEEKMSKHQREFMLREQLKQIKKELGIDKDDGSDTLLQKFKERLEGKTLPKEVQEAIDSEVDKFSNLAKESQEYQITRNYLDWLTGMPWGVYSKDTFDLKKAREILDRDHYGLSDIKDRIREFIAVGVLKGSMQGKILCFVGPPGVGKTSIGKSIAEALGREFHRFSVGGLYDVAEIKGHRRTYVGAMPGKIIQALKIKQVSNPVILVDEVDKLGRDFRGDPSSALLEVLDPEQNAAFRDLYLDVPFDLSKVLFICTANVTDTIPGPLLDRMEVIRLAGYVYEEKLAIANQYLVPQTIASNGVAKELLDLQPEALAELIRNYAREAGVRELRKLLEKITRKVALSLVRVDEEARERSVISLENLRKFVGQPPHSSERLFQDSPSGVAMGLAWTALGGKTLFVEARGRVPASNERMADANVSLKATATAEGGGEEAPAPSRARNSGPRMKVTGKLGKVMGESSEIALTYAKIFLRELEPKNEFLDMAYIHMNMPEGAISKDGPSAGVTMTSALLSMALDRPVKRDLAMSGEVTLTGKVLRVGGIKEKTLAAKRENVDRLVLPMSNQADYLELKPYLRAGLTAHFVDHYDDVYRLAFQDTGAPMPEGSRGSEVVTVVTPEEEKTPLMMSQATVADSATAAV
mmetsp:Transcript_3856/g.9187  ORF Transcript_3856/g.9187 Transcript_3856/m.9187 type:complete len:811 (-) Transcript_3856:36-2468(-)